MDEPTVLACCPVDRSRLPQIPELDAIVITDLYIKDACELCNQDVWVGPRQDALRQERDIITLCYLCAMALYGADDVFDLGGGSSVEGVPING
jgi:hypothetical protein